MSKRFPIVLCPQHRLTLPDGSAFSNELLSFWSSISSKHQEAAFESSEYSLVGWLRDSAVFLQKHFGYRAGNFTYFRHHKKVRDTLGVPTWFFLPRETEMDYGVWMRVRLAFQKGETQEAIFSADDGGLALTFPRPTVFETNNDCALLSDGEVSYRCLQYLSIEFPATKLKDPAWVLRCWMIALGLLGDDNAPTVRLVRMLTWIQWHTPNPDTDEALIVELLSVLCEQLDCSTQSSPHVRQGATECSVPHPEARINEGLLSSLLDLLISSLSRDVESGKRIGINALGHLALRCVQAPLSGCEFPESISDYLQDLPNDVLDMTCTDRSVVIVPLSVSPIEDKAALRAYYFGSHLGLSTTIQQLMADEPTPVELYSRLSLCVTALGARFLLAKMALIESELHGKQLAAMIAHDTANSIYESLACARELSAEQLLSVGKEPLVRSLLVSNMIQRRLMVGMFGGPWVQREQQHRRLAFEWSRNEPTSNDAAFWDATFACQAAAILRARSVAVAEGELVILYSFASELLGAAPLDRIIDKEEDSLYGLLIRLKEFELIPSPWPIVYDRRRNLMSYEGQQAVVLWTFNEILRNAVGYVVDCIRDNLLLDRATRVIRAHIDLDASNRRFEFRVENCLDQNRGFEGQLPRVLRYIRNAIGVEIRQQYTDQRIVFEAVLQC